MLRSLCFGLFLVLGSIALATACGSHDGATAPRVALVEVIPECEAYVDAYRACFGALGAEARRLTDERSDALTQKYLLAAREPASRESARVECARATKQVKEACR